MLSDGAVTARHRRRGELALYLVIFVVGALPVAFVLALPHGLYGITEYDDGVSFAAALRLVAGVLPYRDFVFVEPPGITLLLAPFAGLAHLLGGREALAAARLATMLVAGANAALVASLLRRRGRLAMAVGGLALGVFPTAYAADHTFLLEPFCILFCLIGLRLVFAGGAIASARRCAVGGAAVAFACDVKTLALVVLVVLLAVLLVAAPRRGGAFCLGVAAAVALTALPFLLAAPHAFIHEVVVSQLTRGTTRPTPLLNRLFALAGLAYASPSLSLLPQFPSLPKTALPTVLVCTLVALDLALLGVRLLTRRERSPFSWFVFVGALAAAATAFGPPAYYAHYAYFAAPFLALALGEGAGLLPRLLERLSGQRGRKERLRSRRLAAAGALVLLGGASALVLAVSIGYHSRIASAFGDDGATVAAVVPPGSCVVSDSVNVLVTAGRAFPGPAGCPAIVDATGTWLSADPAHPPTRLFRPYSRALMGKDPALVAEWSAIFSRVQYFVASGCNAFRVPWTGALLTQFEEEFTHVSGSPVYARRPARLAHLPAGGLPTAKDCLLP